MARYVLAALALAATAPSVGWAQAARQIPRYTPATPTTSRFLTIFQGGVGGAVTSYYGVVRPQQRQEVLLQQQRVDLQQTERRLDLVQRDTLDPEVRPTGRAGWFKIDSERQGFGNRSQYFFRWDDRRLPARR